MQVTRKEILAFTLTPQIIPRLRELFGSGFSYIAYFIALVYNAVRLLPNNHPYVQAENIGRFGLRHVVAEAANNLTIDTKHIDQILVFATVLIGLVIGAAQIVLFIAAIFATPAMAQTLGIGQFLNTPSPANDLAHMMMDMVFGVPGIFNSCVSDPKIPCVTTTGAPIESIAKLTSEMSWPYPIHNALHQMLSLYSMGLLTVAVMITSYFVATVALETAQTGTPFGKRYNKVWAPIRIIMAFGLLIPIGYGLNSSQYIVLYAAKYGSAFASNGWIKFNNTISNEFLGQTKNLVSRPNIPEVTSLMQFMYTAQTCALLENGLRKGIENSYLTHTDDYGYYNEYTPYTYDLIDEGISKAPEINEKESLGVVRPYLVKNTLNATNSLPIIDANTSYKELIKFAKGSNTVLIRFGIHNPEKFPRFKGNVSPICGEIKFDLTSPNWAEATEDTQPGVTIMQKYFWYIIKEMWFSDYVFQREPERLVVMQTQNADKEFAPIDGFSESAFKFYSSDLQAAMLNPQATQLDGILDITEGALPAQAASGGWQSDSDFLEKGWAAAGMWYNKIAELNGAVTGAVLNIPTVSRYPQIMREVYEAKKLNDQKVDVATRFNPEGVATELSGSGDEDRSDKQVKAVTLWLAFNTWKNASSSSHTAPTGNAFTDTINAIFGTDGLYSMRRNVDVHPLAQLVGIGKSLVESTINNIGYSVVGAGFAGIANLVDKSGGNTVETLIGFMISITMVGLVIGFILFYVVPFLPFIYFFFAVGGWIKGIFEALVGAPLWALAHIRIDGQGLPGQAAKNGYFLIFEIFIRPILSVFGLLAGISIFAASVAVLNDIWDLVTSNLTGFDVHAEMASQDELTTQIFEPKMDFFRSAIDQFAYTVVYAIVVYMMALPSFKMIDMVPNQILRWMGSDVTSFNDSREDPAGKMVSTAYLGTDQVLGKLDGPLSKGVGKIANLGG